MLRYFLLVFLMGCNEISEDSHAKIDSVGERAKVVIKTDDLNETPDPSLISAFEPEPEVLAPAPGPIPPLPMPIYTRGGGGVKKRLPCENGTSDCNDHNPCSIDSCENDVCVHVLDTTKDQFGSCEVDGHSCSIGRCLEADGQIQCFEQRREFIEGELGCQDGNSCTADSCIEFPLESSVEVDGIRLDNTYECVAELASGLLCQSAGCVSGFC